MADLDGQATLTFTEVLMHLSIRQVKYGDSPHDELRYIHAQSDLIVQSVGSKLRELAGLIESGAVVDVQRCFDYMHEIEAA